MIIVIVRETYSPSGVYGHAFVNGQDMGPTIEHASNFNRENESCINEGIYGATYLENHIKYGECFQLEDKYGREDVFAHEFGEGWIANKDLGGCVGCKKIGNTSTLQNLNEAYHEIKNQSSSSLSGGGGFGASTTFGDVQVYFIITHKSSWHNYKKAGTISVDVTIEYWKMDFSIY